jgi:integrase
VKWAHASAKHRISIAEALATIMPTFLTSERGRPAADELRAALYGWAFNRSRREAGDLPADVARVLRWVEENCVGVGDAGDAALTRRALDALALRLDGKPAAANTIARKRAVYHGALQYAVELRRIDSHPFAHVSWTAPKAEEQVDRRTVVNPGQARALIDAAGAIRADTKAFFGTLYYAALRPEEALHLVRSDFLPAREPDGWGWLELSGATVAIATDWSDDSSYHHDRALKHRSAKAVRRVPVAPELAKLLNEHIKTYQVAADGRLFVVRTGANPGRPLSSSTYTRVWRRARAGALTKVQQASLLATVPYQLRHAGVSLWLNAGVPAPQVAEWAGHSLHVLLKVYAKCIDGQEDAARARIGDALRVRDSPTEQTDK